MAALATDNYTGAPDELLERARQVAKTPESAALMLAAVNKRLLEIAPEEEPFDAAKRLAAEWDRWVIEESYDLLQLYYQDSLNADSFDVTYESIDHEDYICIAVDMLGTLKDGNG